VTLLEPVPELAELPVLAEPSLELVEPDKPEPLLDPLESDEPDEPEPLLDVVDTVAVDFVFVASAGSLPVTSETVITSQAATNRATAPPTTRRRSARARAARLALRLAPVVVASGLGIGAVAWMGRVAAA
jgi:hypothetical protein